jgi:ATP-dependent DNA helicase RecG
MKGTEKDAVMTRFATGDLDVLVATTVIEVGVDVKSATIMIIEQAERFGLAGLHQLRGRVGRGSEKSQCLLLHSPHLTDTARQRLNVMRETDDGFILAEEDLKLRGAGEMIGTRQSGLLEFRMVDPSVQNDLLWTATKDAQTVLSLDPTLTSPRGEALRLLLYLFRKDSELQTLKAG